MHVNFVGVMLLSVSTMKSMLSCQKNSLFHVVCRGTDERDRLLLLMNPVT